MALTVQVWPCDTRRYLFTVHFRQISPLRFHYASLNICRKNHFPFTPDRKRSAFNSYRRQYCRRTSPQGTLGVCRQAIRDTYPHRYIRVRIYGGGENR